jgi:DNA-binding PadR family transcriptional regulator
MLYWSIQRMLEQGLLVETKDRPAPEQDEERRRYYRITAFGAATGRERMRDRIRRSQSERGQ